MKRNLSVAFSALAVAATGLISQQAIAGQCDMFVTGQSVHPSDCKVLLNSDGAIFKVMHSDGKPIAAKAVQIAAFPGENAEFVVKGTRLDGESQQWGSGPMYKGCVMGIDFVLCHGNAGGKRIVDEKTLKSMSTFLSNFTEVRMFNADADSLFSNPDLYDLIHFAIRHDWINNAKTHIKASGGKFTIDEKYVRHAIKRYFGRDVGKLMSVGHEGDLSFEYNGKSFSFEGADGEMTYYANVTRAVEYPDGTVEMVGAIQNADEEYDIYDTFVAKAKKHIFEGKERLALIYMNTVRNGLENWKGEK